MSEPAHIDPQRRKDFVLIFDVVNGNPNGDPDAGNLPRIDPETMHGLVTDVCIKRKVRNYVSMRKGDEPGYGIYVREGVALNTMHKRAYEEEGLKPSGSKEKTEVIDKVRKRMCDTFYDIRMFGAVMTTGVNCGQVRGPVQLTFARSVDPIVPMDIAITRVAITREEDAVTDESSGPGRNNPGKTTEMGRKALIPYGLYVGYGFYSVPFGEQTGVSSGDLELFWEALQRAWDLDRSASRGMMSCRGLYVFTHEHRLGDAPAQDLFELIEIRRRDSNRPAREFSDYEVIVNEECVPQGVELVRLVG